MGVVCLSGGGRVNSLVAVNVLGKDSENFQKRNEH